MSLQEVIIAVQNGLKFSEMTEFDRQGFAGAEEGSLIAESDLAVFILKGNRLDILTEDYQTTFDLNETFSMEI